MAKKFILGNWKMHGLQVQASMLVTQIAAHSTKDDVEVVLFPPFTALTAAKSAFAGTLKLGAQDCSPEAGGAFTGDISAEMLSDAGCTYVILGHSERRTIHGETDETVKRKAVNALKAELIPVICVGESLEQREKGNYLQIIEKQVKNSLPDAIGQKDFIIAYEPVWAIGSGKIPTLGQIEEVHKTIATLLSYATSGARSVIVYGGSVKASNARELLASDLIDGVLVGGASLKAEEFCGIIAAA